MEELEEISARSGFWNETEKASRIMKELENIKEEVENWKKLEEKIAYLEEFAQVAETVEEKKEIEAETEELEKEIAALEFKTLLKGEYDKSGAILAIHAGAGGVDAQDWSMMLLRMYLRWAERKGLKAKILDESPGTEAGVKSVIFEIEGDYVYGYLKGEAGTHRLVRLSPFNADKLRQTSFALVEVLPVIDEIEEVSIKEKDLRMDTFRASGAGGQYVNKTNSAVRLTHLPTGLVVACQSERSQAQNKERALKILRAKIHQKYLREKEEEKRKLRGEFHSPEWGSQIRSYVLHPYKLVKDHRNKFETAETEKVLNGEIDEFIEAYLRM